ncbi:MAG TPA: heparan-alpha-glucosaminide N-acetyltransferase domain-containing protein [Vicinamibacterales bacterium]|nr:heparan-alpha-glucosaminide N-acetyltransferase domain-containing protein [Vicinamibacterales bacterium]
MTNRAVRYAYLDRVRGLAVLIMVEAHVLDSWTHVADRAHPGFGYAMMLGGLGAPLFLFLAGVSVVLSADSKIRKTGDFGAAWRAVQKRGWQVFGLAFLFRLQSYVLSGGFSAASLLKVDILNIMGPAIAMAAIAGGMVKSAQARAVLFVVCAVVISMVTPIVRATTLLDWLPDPVEWYFRPSAGRTNFTLFPWAGFVFAGAVVGMVINRARAADKVFRVQLGLAVISVLLAVFAYKASFLPSIYARSEFWTSSPTFFFVRVGLLTLLLPLAFLWDRAPWRAKISRWSPLETLGRASLFVYWIHVEMVYGFFSRPVRRSLSFPEALGAYALFTVFLLALVMLRDRLVNPYLTDSKSVI